MNYVETRLLVIAKIRHLRGEKIIKISRERKDVIDFIKLETDLIVVVYHKDNIQ